MPIEVEGGSLRAFSQPEFTELDRVVTGLAFQIHNQFGRYLKEFPYKTELKNRCRQLGIPTERELRVWVRHGSFVKEYKLDLVFSHGSICEAKAAECLAPIHIAQTLNYLLLTETQHAKLINFGTDRVQSRFVSSKLKAADRKRLIVEDFAWRNVNPQTQFLKNTLLELLRDWGAFLEVGLYQTALTHFLGGEAHVVQRLPILSGEQILGEQEFHLVTADCGFLLSAVTGSTETMRTHWERLLAHTPLQHLHWVNLNHHQIEFVTLSKPGS